MVTVVAGSPFAGKRLWVDREIEAAESAGTVGTLALDFTSIYSAVVPGLASVYRDQRVTDSGAARFADWALAVMVREANARELDGYVLTDSPRRALALAEAAGGAPVVEVVVSQKTALKRSREHVELVKALAPRAAADDGAAERCRKMVEQYYREGFFTFRQIDRKSASIARSHAPRYADARRNDRLKPQTAGSTAGSTKLNEVSQIPGVNPRTRPSETGAASPARTRAKPSSRPARPSAESEAAVAWTLDTKSSTTSPARPTRRAAAPQATRRRTGTRCTTVSGCYPRIMVNAFTRKFSNRTTRTRGGPNVPQDLLFAACCWFFVLLAVPVARFCPDFLARRFGVPGARAPIAPASAPPSLAHRVSGRFLVRLTACLTPWPARWCVCLPQAVAVALALRVRRRLHAVVRLGVCERAGRYYFHAWAEIDGHPFTDTSDIWSPFRAGTQ